jgi:hypothetical protein
MQFLARSGIGAHIIAAQSRDLAREIASARAEFDRDVAVVGRSRADVDRQE